MKKLVLFFIVTASLMGCTSSEPKTSKEDANIALFKENATIVKTLLDGFVKNDFSQDDLFSDTAKFDGPGLGAVVLNKTSNLAALKILRDLDAEVSYSDLQFFPAVDSITFKPDGNVRVFAKWSGTGKNGATVKNKYFGIFVFNTDHKVIYVDEYQDMTGIIQALTAPKK